MDFPWFTPGGQRVNCSEKRFGKPMQKSRSENRLPMVDDPHQHVGDASCRWLDTSVISIIILYIWRFPKVGVPQVTIGFNTKWANDLDDLGYPCFRKPA